MNCPFGHEFGKDFDIKVDCMKCTVYDECMKVCDSHIWDEEDGEDVD